MKKLMFLGLAAMAMGLSSCGAMMATAEPAKTQLEMRQFQTRRYQSAEPKVVMKAMVNVLQDMGYVITNANSDLGLLTAQKEEDMATAGQEFLARLAMGNEARYNKHSVVECNANVTEMGEEIQVRATFQEKVMNNVGNVTSIKQVQEGLFYENFFSAVSKGVFLQKAKV